MRQHSINTKINSKKSSFAQFDFLDFLIVRVLSGDKTKLAGGTVTVTRPIKSRLIWVYIACPGTCVSIIKVITADPGNLDGVARKRSEDT